MPPDYVPNALGSAARSSTVAFTAGYWDLDDLGWPMRPTGINVTTTAGIVKGLLVDDTGTPGTDDREYYCPLGTSPLRFRSIKETGTTAAGLTILGG